MEKDSNRKKFIIIAALVSVLILLSLGGLFYWFRTTKSTREQNKTTDKTDDQVGQKPDASMYQWSTMNQGPCNDKVSYATSSDLLNWTDSGKILATHASVPDAVIKDGIIYSYFVDVSTDGIAEQTGMVKSTDGGNTWSERQIIKVEGIGDRVAADPDPFLLPDGRIRLYYFDINADRIKMQTGGPRINKIYSAISTDGVNFKQENGVRFEHEMIFDPDVIKVENTWRMYAGTDKNKVISATSSDGLTFTYEGVAAENAGVPNVYHDGTKYLLFTAGIEIFTSTDGKTFTKTSSSFRVSGGVTADPGVVKITDGKYLMVYKMGIIKPKRPEGL